MNIVPTVSSSGSDQSPSPTLAINERVNQLWAAGETVYHLGFGESRFPVHPKLATALADNAQRKSYLPGAGLPELRQAVAHFYSREFGIDASPDQVIIAPGSKALLFAAQMCLDGATVLPTPAWVSYAPQAKLLRRPVLSIPASPADGHRLHPAALEQTLDRSPHRQHLLILNSPNNPSGQMLDPAQLQEIAHICRRGRVLVLSDEIYARTAFGQPHLSISRSYPEGTVVLGGLSKHLSLGGWRLGVAVLPPGETGQQLLQAINKIGSELWSTAPAPMQYAAVTAYTDDAEIAEYIDECTRLHAARTRFLWQGLAELDIPCAQPQGGFYLFPNFDQWREPLARRGIHTSAELAQHLLDDWQIATLPGSVFGTPPQELSLRLSSSYVDLETDAKAQALLDASRTGLDSAALLRQHHPLMQQALQQFRRFLASLARP